MSKKVNRLGNHVKTFALTKYRKEHNLTNQQLADKIGMNVQSGTVSYYCMKGTVPRVVLDQLGIAARDGAARRSIPVIEPKGEIYVTYVGKTQHAAFVAFCEALKINYKTVV